MSKTFDKLKGAEREAVLRAGALKQERIALSRLRPARRAPLDLQPISGERLHLKLEFAFPAARR